MASKKTTKREKKPDKITPGFNLLRTLRGDGDLIYRIAWSPNGHEVASPCANHSVWLWDVKAGKLLHKLKGHKDEVGVVAWSPEGSSLASGADDKTVRIWDIDKGNKLHILKGHKGKVLLA